MFTNLDLVRVIELLLPLHRRKPRIMALLHVLLSPLDELFSRQNNFKYWCQNKVLANSQVAVLEKNLCDLLDLPNRYILIGESEEYRGYIVVESLVVLDATARQKIHDYIKSISVVGLQKPLIIV